MEVTIEEIENDIFNVLRKHFNEHPEISRLHAQDMTREQLHDIITRYHAYLMGWIKE